MARVHHPVEVLGPGRRIGVWFQGCTIGCAGCMSKDTWDPDAVDPIDVDALVALVLRAAGADDRLTGLTVSGGEPFQQPEALLELLRQVRAARPDVDVLVYSGYPLARLEREHTEILGLVDAVISEPFVDRQVTDRRWRGSANQRLSLRSSAAVDRYGEVDDDASVAPGLQVAVDDAGLWVLGIPRRGDLDALQRSLAERGLVLEDVSWAN